MSAMKNLIEDFREMAGLNYGEAAIIAELNITPAQYDSLKDWYDGFDVELEDKF
jgi:hypothetical protein